jgi:hypothetical protein
MFHPMYQAIGPEHHGYSLESSGTTYQADKQPIETCVVK